MTNFLPKEGELLIADTSLLQDEHFTRSVILINHVDEDDVVGFILNRPSPMQLSDIVPGINQKFILHLGGPVDQENLYFIHTMPHLIPGSVQVAQGIYWGGQFEVVEELINSGILNTSNIKFFLGYTGWAKPQLDEELIKKSWIPNRLIDNNDIFLFRKTEGELWQQKMKLIGGEYLIWSNAPENPSLN